MVGTPSANDLTVVLEGAYAGAGATAAAVQFMTLVKTRLPIRRSIQVHPSGASTVTVAAVNFASGTGDTKSKRKGN